MNTESTKCLISFSTGSCQERGSSPLPGNSVAAVVQCPEYAHQGSVLWTPEDDVTLRKADSQRHRPHLSRARILQGERQFGPGSALQRHEGESLFVLWGDCVQINWKCVYRWQKEGFCFHCSFGLETVIGVHTALSLAETWALDHHWNSSNHCHLRRILWLTARLAIVKGVHSLWDCYSCR